MAIVCNLLSEELSVAKMSIFLEKIKKKITVFSFQFRSLPERPSYKRCGFFIYSLATRN